MKPMSEEQAKQLIATIQAQLPHHLVTMHQSADTRNAPRNWFVAVMASPEASEILIVNAEYEWAEYLRAWRVIGAA